MMIQAKRGIPYIVVPAGALALLYLVGTNRCYPIVDDSLPFALSVHSNPEIHVHHLILVMLAWLNKLLGFTDPDDVEKTLLLFRIYVAGSSFLGLYLVGTLSYKWFGSLRTAVVSILLTGFAAGYWLYSMITDIPIPATAFALLAVYFADRSFDDRPRGYIMLLLASFTILVAALNHQAHSLVVIPITIVILLWRRGPVKRRAARAIVFFALTAVLGFSAFYSGYLAADTDSDFLTFIRGYQTRGKAFTTDRLQLLTPAHTVVGVTRAVLYPEYLLHFDSGYEWATKRFPFRLLAKYRYLTRNIPAAVIWIALAISGALFMAWVFLTLRALRCLRARAPDSPGFWMVLAWIVVQGLFSTWWLATSREFWIWAIPCMSLVGTGLAITTLRGRLSSLPWVLVVALCAVNLPALSSLWSEQNCLYWVNKTFVTRLRPNDLAVSPRLRSIKELTALRASSGQVLERSPGGFSFDDPGVRSAVEAVRRNGGRIILDPILVMPDPTEIYRLKYYLRSSQSALEAELLRLESFCEAAGIPIYGVMRKGGDVVAFQQSEFGGYLKWVDSDLNVVGTNATQ
jgi:hypothetical protein